MNGWLDHKCTYWKETRRVDGAGGGGGGGGAVRIGMAVRIKPDEDNAAPGEHRSRRVVLGTRWRAGIDYLVFLN